MLLGEPDRTPIIDCPWRFPTLLCDRWARLSDTVGRLVRCNTNTHRRICHGTSIAVVSSSCSHFHPSGLLKKALTAGRSPEVTAVASSVGISGMAETVAEGSVAFCNSSSIDRCGVGNSRVVRNDDGKWRRRALRSISPRSHSPPACRNVAIHCEGFSSTSRPLIDNARLNLW